MPFKGFSSEFVILRLYNAKSFKMDEAHGGAKTEATSALNQLLGTVKSESFLVTLVDKWIAIMI